MDWRHQSACRDEDPELFFPVGNTGPAITQIEEAKKVCNRCIVKEPCLAWALESGQDAGVWGGLSEDERRALKRRAARNRARLQEQNQINNPALSGKVSFATVEFCVDFNSIEPFNSFSVRVLTI